MNMKKQTVSIIIILIILAVPLSFGTYEIASGKTCEVSRYLCLSSKGVQIIISVFSSNLKLSVPNEVTFEVDLIAHNPEMRIARPFCFNEHWNFGDGTQYKTDSICIDGGPLPTNAAYYEKKHIYSKPGVYQVSMQLLNDNNNLITTSNVIPLTISNINSK